MKRGFAEMGFRTRNVFWTYFVSYIIVIILPVLGIGAFAYTLASNMVEEEVSRAALHSSRQKSASMDQFALEIQSIAVRIGLDGRIVSYANNPDQLFLLNDLKDTLKSITGSNDSIQSIEMYFLNSNQIVSSDGFTRSFSGLERDIWIRKAEEEQGGISFWLSTRQVVGSEIASVVTLVLKMPIGMKDQIGLLAIHVYEKKLLDILKKQEGNQNTNTYLIDGGGSLITSFTQSGAGTGTWPGLLQEIGKDAGDGSFIQSTGSRQALITYVKPLKNGWQIVTETSLQYLYQRLGHIRDITFAACGLLILVGSGISFWLSRKMYHPIERLLAKTSDFEKALNRTHGKEGHARNEFHIINRAIEVAFKSNNDWEKHYRTNYPAMRERFVMGLLQNKFSSKREIEEKMEYLRLELPENDFVVMLLEIDQYSQMLESYSVSDQNLFKYAIENIAEELALESFRCVTAEADEHQFALLLNVEPEQQADTTRFKELLIVLAERIRNQIHTLLRLSVTVSVGSVYSGITNAHLSLKEAQGVMRVKFITGPCGVLFHEELNQDHSSDYYFPVQTANRILNHLKAGQMDEVEELLEHMRDEMKQKPNIGQETIYRLYSRLLDEVLLYMQELGMNAGEMFKSHNSMYRELAQKETLDAIHEWFVDRMGRIISYAAAQPKNNKYIDQVMEYIRVSYHLDLSLERIADHVKLNHAYLSRMFKQETGKTVVEYLTQIRLDASKSLLRSTERTIQDIAEEVGYLNVNSFIRFFKRYEGITPGEYRKMAADERL
jgi:two-component system, response regulator YesN